METKYKLEVAKVGDEVKYNGVLHESLFEFEKNFMKMYMNIGELYYVEEVKFNFLNSKIPWYKIIINNQYHTTFWIPYTCFDIEINIKEKYGLR